MTQARTRANGLVIPSLPQLLLTAMLRALVVIVQNVVSTFQMKRNRRSRDWHTGSAHASLPRMKSDIQHQENNLAIPQDSPSALMVSSMAKAMRSSNHEGVLIAAGDTLAQPVDMSPPPSGGGATRTKRRSSPTGWGTALAISSRRQTVPHLDRARVNAYARPSSPARGRTNPAPV